MLRIEVRALVKPTEDVDRVSAAIVLLFPDAAVERTDRGLIGQATSLNRLRELIMSAQIPDAARGAMLRNLSEDGRTTDFLLGKQAAAVGRIHFGPVRGSLGELEVTLRGDEPGEVERAVYGAAHDTTVPLELAKIPPSERPEQPDEPAA